MISVGGRNGYLLGYFRTFSISSLPNKCTIGIPAGATSRTMSPYFLFKSEIQTLKNTILVGLWCSYLHRLHVTYLFYNKWKISTLFPERVESLVLVCPKLFLVVEVSGILIVALDGCAAY